MRKYDLPYKYRNWPKWVKALVNIEAKNLWVKRMEEKALPFHFNYDEYEEDSISDYCGSLSFTELQIKKKF